MPFNGGGSSSGVTNHNHTNLPNEGGALNNTTLLNAATLVSTPFNPINHLHTAAANSGGALDNTTLLNATTLATSTFDPNDHLQNSQASEGGALLSNGSITTGTSITIAGTEYPIEVLL